MNKYNFKIKNDFIYCYKGQKLYFKVSNNLHNASNLLMLVNK